MQHVYIGLQLKESNKVAVYSIQHCSKLSLDSIKWIVDGRRYWVVMVLCIHAHVPFLGGLEKMPRYMGHFQAPAGKKEFFFAVVGH